MNKLPLFILSLSVAIALPSAVHAEDAKPRRPGAERGGATGGPGARMNPEERLKTMTEKLSLTQEQQDKVKAIMESGRAEFGKLREVPEDQRREKMREAFQKQNQQIAEVLTPEQKEKYKAMMAERAKEGGPGGERKRGEGRPGGAKPEKKE